MSNVLMAIKEMETVKRFFTSYFIAKMAKNNTTKWADKVADGK
ncbi:hypothetical protein [Piscirickettsia litoralis]|nr:hypothetical protein [Piscirickettsia litoralis]